MTTFVSRYRTRYGPHADAWLHLGPLWFHVSLAPYEGWSYRIALGRHVGLRVEW